jgi:galactokinase
MLTDRGRDVSGDAEARAADLAARFASAFAGTPRIYRAPGRVNLIGEHTDYNDGFVLPAALAHSCWVAAAPRGDRRLVVRSEAMGGQTEWGVDDPDPIPSGEWRDYPIGVAAMLRRDGYPVGGASLLIRSDVPMGAGLSSSAAIEVGVAIALADLAQVEIPPAALASLCQRAEHEFAGARCGIMDQFVACHAWAGSALLLDCRSLARQVVPLPPTLRLVACNTMVRHAIATGEYNRRRAECEAAVERIATRHPEVQSLRDVDGIRLESCRRDLSDVLYRRCRHVVSENGRVLQAATAFALADLDAVRALTAESHRSLRDDYEVSCPELDVLVGIAQALPGVSAARMTGGGFGGCTVNLVHADAVDEFCRRVGEGYEAAVGRRPEIYVSDAGGAAARVH